MVSALTVVVLLVLPALSGAADGSGIYSYDENSQIGPANWPMLSIPDNQCGGQKQSPIAISGMTCTEYKDYTFTDGSCMTGFLNFEITNNGVLATYPPAADDVCIPNSFTIPGIEGSFEALQYHIHTSSEHELDGDLHAAELHIVHKSTVDDRLAVVGMFIDPIAATNNEEFDKILRGWFDARDETVDSCYSASIQSDPQPTGSPTSQPTSSTPTAQPTASPTSSQATGTLTVQNNGVRRLETFNPYNLLAEGTGFYHYDGSLTTPPCSEIVFWNLADTATKISVQQYNQLTSLILEYKSPTTCEKGTIASPSGSASRPPQPLNDRILKRMCPLAMEPQPNEDDTQMNDSSNSSRASTAASIVALVAAAFFV